MACSTRRAPHRYHNAINRLELSGALSPLNLRALNAPTSAAAPRLAARPADAEDRLAIPAVQAKDMTRLAGDAGPSVPMLVGGSAVLFAFVLCVRWARQQAQPDYSALRHIPR